MKVSAEIKKESTINTNLDFENYIIEYEGLPNDNINIVKPYIVEIK